MRKFTLTAIAIKDEKVVGAFQLLSLRPQLDGEVLQAAVGKFIEKPYQNIVYGTESMIYLDHEAVNADGIDRVEAELVAFSVWRAAGALLRSKSLETEELKHGSNWLVALDDEPYLVKFLLEDQAQNYIVLNALPDLEMPIVIKDSGWLPTSVPAELDFAEGEPTTALDSGMLEKPLSVDFAESIVGLSDQLVESRSASKALLTDGREGFLAEATMRGQRAVPMDDSPYILSGEVREDAKAVDVEYVDIASSDEYRKFCEEHKASDAESRAGTTTDNYTSPVQAVNSLTKEEVEDVPTNHTELNNPTLEI